MNCIYEMIFDIASRFEHLGFERTDCDAYLRVSFPLIVIHVDIFDVRVYLYKLIDYETYEVDCIDTIIYDYRSFDPEILHDTLMRHPIGIENKTWC